MRGSDADNAVYYDAFSERYERHRGLRDPGGYHDLLDELEADFVRRFASSGDVLEVGCGTGLVLERIAAFASTAKGVDLSAGMLKHARARGLDVTQASATALPFEAATFDVACAFKVLAHIRDIHTALAELARVTRPGGHIIAEFYNPNSMRGLLKRWAPPGEVAEGVDEAAVYTRFDSPKQVSQLVPSGCEIVETRGLRIITPSALVLRVPGLGALLHKAERRLADSPLKRWGGFFLVAMQKRR